MFCYWYGFCGIISMIYELMLYFLVIFICWGWDLNVCVLGRGRDIKFMKIENIVYRNYYKFIVYKILYIFIVNV